MVSIYALINPLSNHVFYIGASVNPEGRLVQHVLQACSAEKPNKKQSQIRDIILSGRKVDMEILDQTEDPKKFKFLEDFYIDLYRSYGFTLCNLTTSAYAIKNIVGAQYKNVSIQIEADLHDKVKSLILSGEIDFRSVKEIAIHLFEEYVKNIEKSKNKPPLINYIHWGKIEGGNDALLCNHPRVKKHWKCGTGTSYRDWVSSIIIILDNDERKEFSSVGSDKDDLILAQANTFLNTI